MYESGEMAKADREWGGDRRAVPGGLAVEGRHAPGRRAVVAPALVVARDHCYDRRDGQQHHGTGETGEAHLAQRWQPQIAAD
jgi:hypothetical protein